MLRGDFALPNYPRLTACFEWEPRYGDEASLAVPFYPLTENKNGELARV